MLLMSGAVPASGLPVAAGAAAGPGCTMRTPSTTMRTNIVTPAIHHGRFCPPTTAAAAARRPVPPPSTLEPHWLQNAAAGAALAPH
jgi:hypothetical protein